MPLTMKMHFCPTRTENTTAHNIPSSRCDYHRFSFFPRTVQEWNTLPEHVVSLTTIKAFKNAIITAWSWTLGTPLYCTVYGVEPLPRGAGQQLILSCICTSCTVVPSSLHLFDFLWADYRCNCFVYPRSCSGVFTWLKLRALLPTRRSNGTVATVFR